jgi:hypothetical protein
MVYSQLYASPSPKPPSHELIQKFPDPHRIQAPAIRGQDDRDGSMKIPEAHFMMKHIRAS